MLLFGMVLTFSAVYDADKDIFPALTNRLASIP